MGHLGLMLVFAAFVSLIFALLMRDDPREQLRFGVTLFAAFIGTGIVLGWLMFAFPL